MLKIPIGIDDFKEIIEQNFVYVDKTLFIEDIVENPAKVQLITRPRRFGKTLNMSMLAYFFDHKGNYHHLFENTAIQSRPCIERCGQHPVIFLTFKKLKAPDYPTFLARFASMISHLYQTRSHLWQDKNDHDLQRFERIISRKADIADLMEAIANLCERLHGTYDKKVVLLIDEYDTPIQEAFSHGYYQELIPFLQAVLGDALKGNNALEKGILTGILRVAKESIFSDLNNLEVHSVLKKPVSDKFGFTQTDVETLLKQAGMVEHLEELRTWYNGYQIGTTTVYNPWSVMSFLKEGDGICRTYWVNTSSNDLVRDLILQADSDTQASLAMLMEGGLAQANAMDEFTFRDLNGSALWSLLLYSGYLTLDHESQQGFRTIYNLRIPNREVLVLYQTIISNWLNQRVGSLKLPRMYDALKSGDITTFGSILEEMVKSVLSYYDTSGTQPERIYHAFVLGLLSNLNHQYDIRSNRESGYGRYDLMMIPKDPQALGIIMEFKTADRVEDLDTALQAGLQQIADQAYQTELKARGITSHTEIAVAFCGKHVKVAGHTRSEPTT